MMTWQTPRRRDMTFTSTWQRRDGDVTATCVATKDETRSFFRARFVLFYPREGVKRSHFKVTPSLNGGGELRGVDFLHYRTPWNSPLIKLTPFEKILVWPDKGVCALGTQPVVLRHDKYVPIPYQWKAVLCIWSCRKIALSKGSVYLSFNLN